MLPAAITEQVLAVLSAYHRDHPQRHGMSRDELRSSLKLAPYQFDVVLKELKHAGRIALAGKWVALPEHRVLFSPFEQVKVEQLLAKFAAAPLAPPSAKDCRAQVGADIFDRLVETGELVRVSPEVVWRKSDYETLVGQVRAAIRENAALSVAQVRDLLGTSRKYALALLEHLDGLGVTVRDGEIRRLREQG